METFKTVSRKPLSSMTPLSSGQVLFSRLFEMLLSQARIKLFESLKSLQSSSGHGLCIRMVIRNLLSSTTPFGEGDLQDLKTETLLMWRHYCFLIKARGGNRAFLGGDQSTKSVSHWTLLEHQDLCQEPPVLHNTVWRS